MLFVAGNSVGFHRWRHVKF